jgi:hypothetical protein
MKVSDWLNIGLSLGALYLGGKLIGGIEDQFSVVEELPEQYPYDPELLTYPEFMYYQYADTLEQLFYGNLWLSDADELAVVGVMTMMQNTADVYKLLNAYGKRCYPVILCESKDTLTSGIQMFLDDEFKQMINENYAEKGIPIQFT